MNAVTDIVGAITRNAEWIASQAHDSEARYQRAGNAGAALARVVYDYVLDPNGVGLDALNRAYETFMAQHAGNFG